MKPPGELTITIPAAIAALPDLNLIEKVILARIHERPSCSNNGLATLTGLSERGIESALARLRKRGLIRSRGHGHARRLMLTFPVEHYQCGENVNAKSHTDCGKNQIENTHTKSGVAANAESLTTSGGQPEPLATVVQYDPAKTRQTVCEYVTAVNNRILTGEFREARAHLDHLSQYLETLAKSAPDLERPYHALIPINDNLIFILEAGRKSHEKLSGDEQFRLLNVLLGGTAERLAELRQQVEAITARGERVDVKRLIGG